MIVYNKGIDTSSGTSQLNSSKKEGGAYGKNTALDERFLWIKKRKGSRQMTAYEVIMIVLTIIALLKKKD